MLVAVAVPGIPTHHPRSPRPPPDPCTLQRERDPGGRLIRAMRLA